MPPKRKESTTRKPPGQGRRKKGDYKKPAHDEKTTKVEQTVARWKALLPAHAFDYTTPCCNFDPDPAIDDTRELSRVVDLTPASMKPPVVDHAHEAKTRTT
jgi:hypothetical protein